MSKFTKKKATKYTIASLTGAYDILKSNQVNSIFTKSDNESIKSDWKFVGRDLSWALEEITKKERKSK